MSKPENTNEAKTKCIFIHAANAFSLKPFNSNSVEVKVSNKNKLNKLCLCFTQDKQYSKNKLALRNTVFYASNKMFPLQIANFSNKEISIQKDSILGIRETIDIHSIVDINFEIDRISNTNESHEQNVLYC
jgi:hypothetical protein